MSSAGIGDFCGNRECCKKPGFDVSLITLNKAFSFAINAAVYLYIGLLFHTHLHHLPKMTLVFPASSLQVIIVNSLIDYIDYEAVTFDPCISAIMFTKRVAMIWRQ